MKAPQTSRQFSILAWGIFVLCIAATILCGAIVRRSENESAQFAFTSKVDVVLQTIANRMIDYESVLNGVKGLYLASKSVERDEFASYLSSLQLSRRLPGIQAIGYSEFVGSKENLKAFEESVRAEGFSNFVVTPENDRNEYHSIRFIEPFDERNRRAFGFDMHTESTRAAAMDRARDTGVAILSGKVTLKQENNSQPQAGTLLYLPIYRKGEPVDTPEQRRAAFQGFAYAAFRMEDLFTAILSTVDTSYIDLEIYSVTGKNGEEDLLYTNEDPEEKESYLPEIAGTHTLRIGGQSWSVRYHTSKEFDRSHSHLSSIIAWASGTVVSILVFTIAMLLSLAKETAEGRAQKIAQEMAKNEDTWKLAMEASGDAVWEWNLLSNQWRNSERGARMLGYNPGELKDDELAWPKVVHPDDFAKITTERERHIQNQNEIFFCEVRMRCKEGNYKWVSLRGRVVVRSANDRPVRMIGTTTDITERKAYEENLQEKNAELERMNELMVGRELKMRDMKDELKKLRGSTDDSASS